MGRNANPRRPFQRLPTPRQRPPFRPLDVHFQKRDRANPQLPAQLIQRPPRHRRARLARLPAPHVVRFPHRHRLYLQALRPLHTSHLHRRNVGQPVPLAQLPQRQIRYRMRLQRPYPPRRPHRLGKRKDVLPPPCPHVHNHVPRPRLVGVEPIVIRVPPILRHRPGQLRPVPLHPHRQLWIRDPIPPDPPSPNLVEKRLHLHLRKRHSRPLRRHPRHALVHLHPSIISRQR